MSLHTKCRNSQYPRSSNKIIRTNVPDDKVSWKLTFPEYSPIQYTVEHIIIAPPIWADKEISGLQDPPQWNTIDGKVNRKSHEQDYEIIDFIPRNIRGRTGLAGRGCLGRWGPNHAADPIVTRWKLNNDGSKVINESSGAPVLQFVSIQRHDCNEWAIPGGMVDPGELVTVTLKREFLEEALNSLEMTEERKHEAENELNVLFNSGTCVYSGYVDDSRNTDNAWMETVAYNFHSDDRNKILYSISLQAGDDAKAVKWIDISKDIQLFASHRDFIERVANLHKSHW